MARINNLTNFLTDVASAIKTKKGDSTAIAAEDFDTEILALPTGIDTSDATATADDIVLNKTAYVDGVKITGTVYECTTKDGFDGNAAEEGTIHGSPALGLIGDVYTNLLFRPNSKCEVMVPDSVIAPIIGLVANKIKQGEVILGVTGSYAGTDTSDATATASDILDSETAYAGGVKLTGTIPVYDSNTQYTADVTQTFAADDTNSKIITSAMIQDAAFKNGLINLRVPYNVVTNTIGLTAGKIKSGETILGITGSYSGIDTSDATATANDIILDQTAYVNGSKITGVIGIASYITTAANPIVSTYTSGDTIRITGTTDNPVRACINPSTSTILEVDIDDLGSAIGLRSDKIKAGESILGVPGLPSVVNTADATAIAGYIASGETAYVNGSKITGTLDFTRTVNTAARPTITNYSSGDTVITITGSSSMNDWSILRNQVPTVVNANIDDLASAIGLHPSKIAVGTSVMGINGTYLMKSYNTTTEMNNDITNITSGEVVRVMTSSSPITYNYYIKDTTMKKLVKEEDTISPEEYVTDLGLATNILGSQS